MTTRFAKTTEQFIIEAKNLHGDKYDYSNTVYVNSNTKVDILCKKHGVFSMRPGAHIHSRQGCRRCSDEAKQLTTEQFVAKARKVHGDLYDYSQVVYTHNKVPVDIMCPTHGLFKQKPNDHLCGTQCPKCATNAPLTTEEFITNAQRVHGKRYDYSKAVYKGVKHKLAILCPKHGEFLQTPDSHVHQQNGCPRCRINNFSKEAIKWLDHETAKTGKKIQHAKNGGEFLIPGTQYHVDGYCEETNTVYEFWGDFWHGNPEVYDLDQLNRVKNQTFGELYETTMRKKQTLIDAGYKVIDIWEKDWYNIKNK